MDARVSTLLHTLGGVYRDPVRVDRDASTLLRSSAGQNLKPNIGELVQNNGDSTTVLVLQGTIATSFRGQTYQTLMDVYLPPEYPRRPPVAFVRLGAPNMYLKENHAHVGRDGQVYLPYLHEWQTNTHNLVEFVVATSSVFSNDPPVFTKQRDQSSAAPPPPPPSYQQASVQQNSQQQTALAEAALAREAEEANRAAEAARLAASMEEEQARARAVQESWDAKVLADTKQRVVIKLQHHLQTLSRDTKASLESDWQDQQLVKAGQKKVEHQLKVLEEAKSNLTKQIETVDKATADITEWLKDAKNNKQDAAEEVSVDDLCQPTSPVYNQMLQLSAENASLTDAMYFLDKGLVKGTVNVTTHLKYVRKLSKRQFLVRAHLLKIGQMLKGA